MSGSNPAAKTHQALAETYAKFLPGFAQCPCQPLAGRGAKTCTCITETGLKITYDPALGDAFRKAFDGPPVDLWPLFDALSGLPIALIRGANSDLLTQATADEMRRRRPDMIFALVPDRAPYSVSG